MLHISEECNAKLKRSILKENDILFSIAGTKMGITAKVTSDVLPANTNQALAIIRLKKEVSINVDFLIELLHADMIIEQIESMKSTVAQTNLSLDNVRNFNVIVPPFELQNQFAAFVEQTDKSKFVIQ
jgi:type I restriction enzyme S subunit